MEDTVPRTKNERGKTLSIAGGKASGGFAIQADESIRRLHGNEGVSSRQLGLLRALCLFEVFVD